MALLERVRAVLYSKGIAASSQDGVLTTPVQTGVLGSQLRVHEQNGLLKCVIHLPIFTPEYRRGYIAEAITRANFGLNSGRFESDMNDGEVRFFNSMPVLDSALSNEQLEYLVFWSWQTANRYSTALFEVAVTDICPGLAIARAEASGREEERDMRLAN